MASERPFVTCHVLDTISGKPGPDINVSLQIVSPGSKSGGSTWTAKTNSDGRVTAWESDEQQLNHVVQELKQKHSDGEGRIIFKLSFDTESYFGEGNTFWPQVDLTFAAKVEEEHYHVPLLLGPWSYTTYRGS